MREVESQPKRKDRLSHWKHSDRSIVLLCPSTFTTATRGELIEFSRERERERERVSWEFRNIISVQILQTIFDFDVSVLDQIVSLEYVNIFFYYRAVHSLGREIKSLSFEQLKFLLSFSASLVFTHLGEQLIYFGKWSVLNYSKSLLRN